MAANCKNHRNQPSLPEDEDAIISMKAQQLVLSLPREKWCINTISPYLYWYQNFWCPSDALHNLLSLQAHFRSHDSDILLATKPKSGTTWLKALAFAILHRTNHPSPHPLLSANPHQLVRQLEYLSTGTHPLDVSKLEPPQLLATHLPYQALTESIKSSGCRIVYLCRNPFDTIVSLVKFFKVIDEEMKDEDTVPMELEKMVDSVCRGVEGYGPHWDHVLGYWNMSLEKPDKVLFMKYEDLKKDEISELKRLAKFLRVPFSSEEEESGVIDEISKLCSLRNLQELEVNQSGRTPRNLENKAFFRKGQVGDWKNHMSPALYEHLEKVMQEKFRGTDLTFETSIFNCSSTLCLK